jgi:hypothetical protein
MIERRAVAMQAHCKEHFVPGYDPSCPNCHRCWKCRGNGVVTVRKSGEDYRGETKWWDEQDTCPSCGGRGGEVGVGPHDHR